MQTRARIAGVALAVAALFVLAAQAGPYAIDLHAVASGGAVASGRYSLAGTASQPDASRAVQSGRYILSSGFWSQFDPGAMPPPLLGPVYPPPQGVNLTVTGTNISRSGGVTWFFTNMTLASSTPVYWGVTNGGVQLSFLGSNPSGSEIMQFDPHQSSLSAGSLVFTGATVLNGYYISSSHVYTRCRVLINQPLIDPANVGLPANLGGVLQITSSNFAWQAQIFMEASLGGVSWEPALDLYDSAGVYGGGTAFSSFAGAFYYLNRLPLVSPIPDIIIAPGTQSGPIPFTVSDPQYPVAALAISTNSDNSLILPNAAIQVSGSGGSYTMTLTTAFNFLGVAHVTIAATDPVGGVGQSVFTVYSDTPPTISSIGPQTTPINTPIGPIGFTVGDNETSAGSLALSAASSNQQLVPVANIVYGGSGANRTVTVTPATGQSGTAQISTVVSDGILTATNSFVLTVPASPPQLGSVTFNASGQLQLQFTAAAGSTNTVLATTNLNIHTALWTVIGTATETSSGHFQFTDTSASSYKNRFYRIRSP